MGWEKASFDCVIQLFLCCNGWEYWLLIKESFSFKHLLKEQNQSWDTIIIINPIEESLFVVDSFNEYQTNEKRKQTLSSFC